MDENQSKNRSNSCVINSLKESAFALFISPLIFLLFLKLVEIRVNVSNEKENLIYGYAAVFIIPFAIGLILYTLYIAFSENKRAGVFGIILTILLGVLSFFILINKSTELSTSLIVMIIIFSLLFSILLTLSTEYFFIKFKNWIFKDDDSLVKNKLSFVNKIILSIATTVASILGIALTLKNLFS